MTQDPGENRPEDIEVRVNDGEPVKGEWGQVQYAPGLEERVAALEARLASPLEPWTDEQIRDFEAEVERYLGPGVKGQVRLMPPGRPAGPVTHIAASQVQVGSCLRQRCAWCGEVLADYDLTRIAVPEGQDPTPGMWAQGDLVRRDGSAWFVVDHENGEDLPGDCCAVTEIDAAKVTGD